MIRLTYPIKPIEPDRQANINNLPERKSKGPEKVSKIEPTGKRKPKMDHRKNFQNLLAQQIERANELKETQENSKKEKGLTAEEAYRLSMRYPIEHSRSKKAIPKKGIQAYEKQIEEASKGERED